jgi:DNA-binding transcriptional LysR family regulator
MAEKAIDYSILWSNNPAMDKFGAMKTFVRIVDCGNLTNAADTLDTSLPTVVRTLAALERELGVTLLKRTTRRIHLTDEGTQYLGRCRDILAATQEAEDMLVARRTEPVGKLAVTASVAFGRRYLTPIVYGFLRRYPKVSADVLLVDRVVDLVDEGIDAAIRIAHLRDSSIVGNQVGRVRRVICASEKYLRQHGVPQIPSDIRAHRCVRHVGLSPRNEWRFQAGSRQQAVPIDCVLTCNEIDGAVDACIEGLGLGMFLSYMVAPYRKTGQLKYILESFETEPIPVQVVYPQARLMSNRVRVFVDECVAKLRRVKFD